MIRRNAGGIKGLPSRSTKCWACPARGEAAGWVSTPPMPRGVPDRLPSVGSRAPLQVLAEAMPETVGGRHNQLADSWFGGCGLSASPAHASVTGRSSVAAQRASGQAYAERPGAEGQLHVVSKNGELRAGLRLCP